MEMCDNLENVMSDYDLEVRRLVDGLETTRNPNPKSRLNAELRTEYKTKYLNGTYTAIEYLNFISLTIGGENKSVRLLSTTNELHSINGESDSSDYEETIETRCYVCLCYGTC